MNVAIAAMSAVCLRHRRRDHAVTRIHDRRKVAARVGTRTSTIHYYRYCTTGTVLDLASTAIIYLSYISVAPAARIPRATVAVEGCTAVL